MTDVLMPALSPTMEEGTLAKWHVKAGDKVESGDVIAEIETDKATMEVEAVDEGVVEAILVPEGTENVKVNTPIARLNGDEGAASACSRRSRPRLDAASARGGEAPASPRQRRPRRPRPGPKAQRASRRVAAPPAGSRDPGRRQAGPHHRARRPARRHGRGDAARRRPCS